MKKRITVLASIIALVVLIAGAGALYKYLSENADVDKGDFIKPTQSEAANSSSAEKPQSSQVPSQSISDSSAVSSGNDENKIMAMDFTVYDIDGNEHKLSDFYGKPIVMNFWASWCPPCKAELPDFQKVYDEMKDDVVFLMVDMVDGVQETIEKGNNYFTENNFSMPLYFDSNQEAAYLYTVSAIPTTFFIDKEGYLVAMREGQLDEELLRRGIEIAKGIS